MYNMWVQLIDKRYKLTNISKLIKFIAVTNS